MALDSFVRLTGNGWTFVTAQPKLAVCDRANKRLQWFDMDGKHLNTLDGFLFPADIDVTGRNNARARLARPHHPA